MAAGRTRFCDVKKIRRRHASSLAPLPKAPICCLIVAAAA